MALRDLDPEEHLRDPARKQHYVTTLFDTIAPKYDRFTRLFSFGMDRRWKQQLAAWVAEVVRPEDVVVDLACGTGDVVEAVERLSGWAVGGPSALEAGHSGRPAGHGASMILGLDQNGEMLGTARRRFSIGRSGSAPGGLLGRPLNRSTAHPLIRLLRADLQSLPLAPASVAAVTVGYGFRNVPDVGVALAEVARVVRPGGWLFDLDFFRPERPTWRRLYLWYLGAAGRALGRRWHGDPEAYGYIGRSLERWVTPPEFEVLLERAGFRAHPAVRHLGGGICLHRAQRLD
jgi:demethylmenaquinone methyltransferase/2-methoxy-6-polyprenyl-1,4-benzoquinol methylase